MAWDRNDENSRREAIQRQQQRDAAKVLRDAAAKQIAERIAKERKK